jgi:hypothetical protein
VGAEPKRPHPGQAGTVLRKRGLVAGSARGRNIIFVERSRYIGYDCCLLRGVDTGALPSRFHAGGASLPRRTMVKETKFFRKQADKTERMARSATDVEIS